MTTDPAQNELLTALSDFTGKFPIAATFAALELSPSSESLECAETLIQSEPNNLEIKLAWLCLHIQHGQIPLTVLAGAYDEVVQRRPELGDAGEAVFRAVSLLLGHRLVDKALLRLAVLPIEQFAHSVLRDPIESATSGTKALTLLEQLYDAELLRAELKRESKTYRESVVARKGELASLRAAMVVVPTKSNPASTPPALGTKQYLNSASILAAALLESTTGETIARVEKAKNALAVSPNAVRKYGFPIAIVGLGVLSWWLIPFIFKNELNEDLPARLAVAVSEEPGGEIALPDPGSADLSGGKSPSMLELTKRLEGMKTGRTLDTPSAAISPNSAPQVVLPSTPEPAVSQPTPVPTVAPAVQNKIPKPDLQELGRAQIQDLGTSPPPALPPSPSLPAPLVTGADGRTYGPPPELGGAQSLDGGPVQPYEVEQFGVPQLYRIIAPTKVLSAPSIVAAPIVELRRDAVIQVVARMGRWLEIRSSEGRRGFVPLQDAAPGGTPGQY